MKHSTIICFPIILDRSANTSLRTHWGARSCSNVEALALVLRRSHRKPRRIVCRLLISRPQFRFESDLWKAIGLRLSPQHSRFKVLCASFPPCSKGHCCYVSVAYLERRQGKACGHLARLVSQYEIEKDPNLSGNLLVKLLDQISICGKQPSVPSMRISLQCEFSGDHGVYKLASIAM
jgi:hypothetical protein